VKRELHVCGQRAPKELRGQRSRPKLCRYREGKHCVGHTYILLQRTIGYCSTEHPLFLFCATQAAPTWTSWKRNLEEIQPAKGGSAKPLPRSQEDVAKIGGPATVQEHRAFFQHHVATFSNYRPQHLDTGFTSPRRSSYSGETGNTEQFGGSQQGSCEGVPPDTRLLLRPQQAALFKQPARGCVDHRGFKD
jgi:hypothetical protein